MSDDHYLIPTNVLFRPDCVYDENWHLLSSPEGVYSSVEWCWQVYDKAKWREYEALLRKWRTA